VSILKMAVCKGQIIQAQRRSGQEILNVVKTLQPTIPGHSPRDEQLDGEFEHAQELFGFGESESLTVDLAVLQGGAGRLGNHWFAFRFESTQAEYPPRPATRLHGRRGRDA
jgi:hypothetical protein